jgi:hypothetical protein
MAFAHSKINLPWPFVKTVSTTASVSQDDERSK